MSSGGPVLTLALQWLVALATLGFAVLAFRVARCPTGLFRVHRGAWILVSVAFLVRGGLGIVQNVGAVWAFYAGAESAAFTVFQRVNAMGNVGSALTAVALGWGIAALPLARAHAAPRLWRGCVLAALVLLAAGASIGWVEGEVSSRHVTSLTILSAAELIGLLAALLVGLYVPTLDRFLWTGLGVYAMHVALNVVWYSGMTGFFLPDPWYPSPQVMLSYTLVIYGVVIGITSRRLALARLGIRVGGLLETPGEHRHPALR